MVSNSEGEPIIKSYPQGPLTTQIVPYRGHSRRALEKYHCTQRVDNAGNIIETVYPYPSYDKVRRLADKSFYIQAKGDKKSGELFGEGIFEPGSHYTITLVEGEEDAMAAYEMLGYGPPVFSVGSSSSAFKDCTAKFDLINSFEKIILNFDNDEHGRSAAKAVSSLFDFNKVHIFFLETVKDANDLLLSKSGADYVHAWNNAKRYTPENIVSSFKEYDDILAQASTKALCDYPFSTLQEFLRGIRPGETVLFKALEGIGKTEVMGAIEYHVLKTTKHNVGIIHLEEPIKRTLQRFANYELGYPVHLDENIPLSVVQSAIHRAIPTDERVHFYKNYGSEDVNDVISTIRFLVSACKCRFIFLDHITRLVSGTKIDDERKALDYISTKLSQLADELQFALVMVSHVNDDGKTRGSRNISKEAYAVISLDRDLVSPDPNVRNTTRFTVEKNRTGSTTGPAGECYFDPATFMLSETPGRSFVPV